MISLHAAILIVQSELNKHKPTKLKLMAYKQFTIEQDWGWAMYFGSEEDIRLDDTPFAAYLVNRVTGEIQQTGKSWPVENYIDDYETQLSSINT